TRRAPLSPARPFIVSGGSPRSVQARADLGDGVVQQGIGLLAGQAGGQNLFGGPGGQVRRGGLDLGRGLDLGLGDAALGELLTALERLFQLHLGLGLHDAGVGLGGGEHLGGLGLGLGLLGADLGQQGLGLGAQAGGLVELGLDLGGGAVQLGGDGAGNLHQHQNAEEDDQADADPELGIAEVPELTVEKRGHQAAPLMAASASAAVAALPVSCPTMARAVSEAMAEPLVMAASRVLPMAASASAIRAATTASSAAARALASSVTRALAAAAVAREEARACSTSALAISAWSAASAWTWRAASRAPAVVAARSSNTRRMRGPKTFAISR